MSNSLKKSVLDTLRTHGSMTKSEHVKLLQVYDAIDELYYDDELIESYWASYENDQVLSLPEGA